MEYEYDRSHEECDECQLEKVEPKPCKGHQPGPSRCPEFKRKGSEAVIYSESFEQWLKSKSNEMRSLHFQKAEIDYFIDNLRLAFVKGRYCQLTQSLNKLRETNNGTS